MQDLGLGTMSGCSFDAGGILLNVNLHTLVYRTLPGVTRVALVYRAFTRVYGDFIRSAYSWLCGSTSCRLAHGFPNMPSQFGTVGRLVVV